jgi:hypothetical protein
VASSSFLTHFISFVGPPGILCGFFSKSIGHIHGSVFKNVISHREDIGEGIDDIRGDIEDIREDIEGEDIEDNIVIY